MELQGKVAFVTGGANGMGKEFTRALLERGAKVTFTDIDEKGGKSTLSEFQQKFGAQNVFFYAFDMTDMKQYDNAFSQAVAQSGPMDILINNAGIMNEGLWEKMIEINVTAVVKGIKLAEKVMRKDKGGRGGRVINISSCAALNPSCYVPIYGATKTAVTSYTTNLATQIDLEAQGMEYAQLCPDSVNTELNRQIDATRVNYYESVKESFKEVIQPSRIVEALLQLLSLERMNGAILHVREDALMYQAIERREIGLTWNGLNN